MIRFRPPSGATLIASAPFPNPLLPRASRPVATEAIAKCVRSGGVGKAKSNIELLGLVPTPAAADWDASFTMERINL